MPSQKTQLSPPPSESTAYLEHRLIKLAHHMGVFIKSGVANPLPEVTVSYIKECEEIYAAFPKGCDDASLPSLERIRRRFSLNPFEENVLLLALSVQIDVRFGEYIVHIKQQMGRTHVDIGLALELFSPTLRSRMQDRAAFGGNGKLPLNHLIALDARSAERDNLLSVILKVPARMQGILFGTDTGDPSIEGFSRLVWPKTTLSQVMLSPNITDRVLGLVGRFDEFLKQRAAWGYQKLGDSGEGVTLLFAGPPGTGKTLLSHALGNHLGRPLLLVDAAQLQTQRGLESSLDTLLREARLQRAVLLFDDCELLFSSRLSGNRELPLLLAALDAYEGVIILATNIPDALDEALDRRIILRVDFELPVPTLREKIWRQHIPPATPLDPDVDIRFLSEKFEFSGGYISNSITVALNSALARGGDSPSVCMQDFEDAAKSQIRHKLSDLGMRSNNHLSLDDLVLPDDLKQSLDAIIAAVRNRRLIFDEWGFGERLTTGRGICILFRGVSGTGKTLSAEILANELGMSLYRIRIPSIISKYVGETEKNLERCFREGARSGSMLLFDEADSLFSKRIEVSSSNDRYANMEVNLLLQEIERFDGVVILTTNNDAAIDDAFERRLNHKISFPFPDESARSRIWRKLIPARAPLGENVNFEFLGEDFELSGGCIKNAVLRAAYQAAELKTSITMELLEQSAVQEYREAGKLPPTTQRALWDL